MAKPSKEIEGLENVQFEVEPETVLEVAPIKSRIEKIREEKARLEAEEKALEEEEAKEILSKRLQILEEVKAIVALHKFTIAELEIAEIKTASKKKTPRNKPNDSTSNYPGKWFLMPGTGINGISAVYHKPGKKDSFGRFPNWLYAIDQAEKSIASVAVDPPA